MPGPTPATLERINYVNIGLMFASAALACLMPFEAFLGAYAVLGPLHYLTQISWLHDRGYYTTGGAEGVGKATTNAVVSASLIILLSDFFLTKILF